MHDHATDHACMQLCPLSLCSKVQPWPTEVASVAVGRKREGREQDKDRCAHTGTYTDDATLGNQGEQGGHGMALPSSGKRPEGGR